MDNCLRCGRPLKNKESIKRGYGPGCYKRIEKENHREENLLEEKIDDIDGQVSFVDEIRSMNNELS